MDYVLDLERSVTSTIQQAKLSPEEARKLILGQKNISGAGPAEYQNALSETNVSP